MDDLISRQAAIDAVIKRDANCGIDSAEVLKALPSVQQERKTGEWLKTTKHHADDKQEFDYYEIACSVCSSRPEKAWHLTPYCPNCGAKMKAREEER